MPMNTTTIIIAAEKKELSNKNKIELRKERLRSIHISYGLFKTDFIVE